MAALASWLAAEGMALGSWENRQLISLHLFGPSGHGTVLKTDAENIEMAWMKRSAAHDLGH
jgi:hypothetical protein